MPLVHPCSEPGCDTLTMGDLCVDHESTVEVTRREPAPRRSVAVVAAAALVAFAVAAVAARLRVQL